jgi:general secretion pathway protein E
MIDLQEIHNNTLEPLELDDYELALKNFVLFSTLDGMDIICIGSKFLTISFDYISKIKLQKKIILLDEQSFDNLYNKFIEIKADKQMTDIATQQEEATLEDDDINIAQFLKISSDIMTSQESAPIIKFVNSLFYQAIKKKASDIHIELHEYKGEIRYRIDGILSKHIELDKNIMALVISRIKVISNLNISEKRVPQDGRTTIKINKKTLDIRVSVLPSFYGERIVMRILMHSEDIPSLKSLGIDEKITTQLEQLTTKSHGMILVTGPTGSGKSTTLHSILQKIQTPSKNIITVEDPVEYKSDKINQIQVNTKVGLTFASGLRSILRQDPDIIMVGEIRDNETAKIAIQSALTGHMVFSTLHTNTAPASIVRLVDMGIDNFLISSSVIAVLSQRLVRQLCDNCKAKDAFINNDLKSMDFNSNSTIFKKTGCKKCNYTGYKGRKAVAELFIINDDVKNALKEKVDTNKLNKIAIKNGMISISEQLKQMCEKGQTSIKEALRVGINQ